MQSIGNFLWGLGGWLWFIIAVAMIVLETVIPGVHFMWFGLAAAIVGAVVLFYPLPVAVQLVAFAAIALIAIVVIRRWWAPERLKTDLPDLNVRGQQYVGRVVTVTESIAGGRGKVRVGDSVWTAEGPDMATGAQARVTGVNGTVLVVVPS